MCVVTIVLVEIRNDISSRWMSLRWSMYLPQLEIREGGAELCHNQTSCFTNAGYQNQKKKLVSCIAVSMNLGYLYWYDKHVKYEVLDA